MKKKQNFSFGLCNIINLRAHRQWLNVLIITGMFAALILSGGCGGGGSNSSKSSSIAQEEKTIAVIKEEGESDAEAAKETEGLINPDTTKEKQPEQKQEQTESEQSASEEKQPEQKPEQSESEQPVKLYYIVLSAASEDDVSGIEEVIIPGNISKIEQDSFDNRWSSLKKVIIMDTNTKLNSKAFNGCPKLEEVCIADGTSSNYFDFKKYVNDHKADIYSYSDQAFYNCPKLKCISFGNVAPPADTAFISGCGSAVGGTIIEAPYAKYSEYSSRLGSRCIVRQKTWSESLPDTMLINQISIPGSHDSCTYLLEEGIVLGTRFTDMGKTQTLTLAQQLEKGVRCFDLRPCHEGSYDNMIIHHGLIPCAIQFHEAISEICNHIKAHPRDFVIVMVNHEEPDAIYDSSNGKTDYCVTGGNVAEGNRAIQNELAVWSEYAAEFKPGMTVKDMRGKILFLSRDYIEDQNPVGAYLRNWGGMKKTAYIQGKNGSETVTLCVQDKYSVFRGDDKYDAIKTAMDYFAELVQNDHSYIGWCINHTSAYMSLVPNYPAVASSVNGRTAEEISKMNGPVGIVVTDYAGEDNPYERESVFYNPYGQTLVDAVINHNF